MRLLLFLITFTFCTTSNSQVLISLLLGDKLNSGKIEFGLDGGMNFSTQTGLATSDALRSFNLGFYFDFKMKESPWMIHTGVIVKSNLGAADLPVYPLQSEDLNNAFVGGSVDRKLSYFNVPVLLKYNFKNHIYMEAGPQLGLLYKAFDEFNNKVNDQELMYKVDIRDQFHALDAGVTFGAGYRFMKGNGMNFGVRYYLGLADIMVNNTGNAVSNRSLYLTVGIPIGAGKAKEKATKKTHPQTINSQIEK